MKKKHKVNKRKKWLNNLIILKKSLNLIQNTVFFIISNIFNNFMYLKGVTSRTKIKNFLLKNNNEYEQI